MNVTGIVWMGVRTAAYSELDRLFGSVMGMSVTKRTDGVTWFELPGGEEIQIFDDADQDHTFFGPGPVLGFRVDDFAGAMTALTDAEVELIGDGDADANSQWQHFRGPDGNIYEILGPATGDV